MEDTEEYMLKWNSHNTEIVSQFHELAKEQRFTDVTLAVEDQSFKAHKLVLSACSPYFKHLLTSNECRHPVICLKDIPHHHVALLLQYMYLGQIAVKREELNTFLRSADHLKIRGLAMNSPTSNIPSNPPRRDVVVPLAEEDEDEQKRIPAAPFSTSNKGRKGYLPKKIRTSGDRISGSSSPGQQSFSDSGIPASPLPQRRNSGSLPPIMETFNNHSGSEDVEQMENLEQHIEGSAGLTPETEAEEDQPVDFSQTASAGNLLNQPRYSILSNYLKTGKLGHKQIHNDVKLDENEAASISKAAENLSASWLDQLSLTGMQPEEEDAKKEKRSTIQETLGMAGIDIAERLRAHFQTQMSNPNSNFLSNLPASSLNWLNNSSPNGKANGNRTPNPVNPINDGDAGSIPNGLNGEKRSVKCEICGKQLADPSSLYRHRKIHTGDKPHKCPYCTRRFIQRYNMKQHIKTHRMRGTSELDAGKPLSAA
jgi:DNA-directed RNA polymerase subunit RPC12/RpoP